MCSARVLLVYNELCLSALTKQKPLCFHSAKSLWGKAPCGSAVYGSLTEMSPAPLPLPDSPSPHARPPPPHSWNPLWLDPYPVDSMAGGRQGGPGRIDEQGRIDDITDAARDFALHLP